jgi:hypothetical protein
MLNAIARDLYQRYLAEHDPVAAEMLRLEYVRSLTEPASTTRTAPTEQELDEYAADLPIGAHRNQAA